MELRKTVLSRVRAIKEMFDLEQEPPALVSQLVQFKDQLAQLEAQLQESHKLSKEKDALIARLRACAVVRDNMIVDGAAFYVKKEGDILDGPFCMSCFSRTHEAVRIVPAGNPKAADGDDSEWVQCSKCRTPFRSKRVGEYLQPQRAVRDRIAPAKKAKPVRKGPAKKAKPVRKGPAKRGTRRSSRTKKS